MQASKQASERNDITHLHAACERQCVATAGERHQQLPGGAVDTGGQLAPRVRAAQVAPDAKATRAARADVATLHFAAEEGAHLDGEVAQVGGDLLWGRRERSEIEVVVDVVGCGCYCCC